MQQRLLIGSLMVLALLPPARAARLSDYAGTWEGTMTGVRGTIGEGETAANLRLVIDGDAAHVFTLRGTYVEDGWQPRAVVQPDDILLSWEWSNDKVVARKGWCLKLKGKDSLYVYDPTADSDGVPQCSNPSAFEGTFKRVSK